ncbi:MAG: histidine kinase dimerization/phospho-acceptor domain-containing protein, partial [Burkholderiaceae bacterium]
MIARHLRSLDLLATAVVILDQELRVVHINQPAEVLFGASSRLLEGSYLLEVLDVAEEVEEMLNQASSQMFESKRLQCDWQLPMRGSVELDSTVSVHLEEEGVVLSLELREIAQQRKADREVHQADLTHANKELLRNLAHDIKNPLGGVRGAAQLLDRELPSDE